MDNLQASLSWQGARLQVLILSMNLLRTASCPVATCCSMLQVLPLLQDRSRSASASSCCCHSSETLLTKYKTQRSQSEYTFRALLAHAGLICSSHSTCHLSAQRVGGQPSCLPSCSHSAVPCVATCSHSCCVFCKAHTSCSKSEETQIKTIMEHTCREDPVRKL